MDLLTLAVPAPPHAVTLDLLTELALIMCVAAVTTALFQRLRQPVVLGYLLAGMLVGPHLPVPLFADERVARELSELGVILLMFSLGLEFSLRKLMRVAPTAGVVAVIECSLMVWLGFLVGRAFGWTRTEALFAGAAIAISSTTIIVKAFAEQRVAPALAEIVFGILIVEDLIAILLLAFLTALASGARLDGAGAGAHRRPAGRLPGRPAGGGDADRAAAGAGGRPAAPRGDHGGRLRWASASPSRSSPARWATRSRWAPSCAARWWPSRARPRSSSTGSSRCAISSPRSSSSRSGC